MPRRRLGAYKEIVCRTCEELIHRFRRSAYPRGHVPKELILSAIRRHYKAEHPRKFKEMAKKAVRTKKARGILDPLYVIEKGYEPEPPIKPRRRLIAIPKVVDYDDYKASGGLIRVLEREKAPPLPEFALYLSRVSRSLRKALIKAGLIEEEKGKWVLRTDKFSIFVYG